MTFQEILLVNYHKNEVVFRHKRITATVNDMEASQPSNLRYAGVIYLFIRGSICLNQTPIFGWHGVGEHLRTNNIKTHVQTEIELFPCVLLSFCILLLEVLLITH